MPIAFDVSPVCQARGSRVLENLFLVKRPVTYFSKARRPSGARSGSGILGSGGDGGTERETRD